MYSFIKICFIFLSATDFISHDAPRHRQGGERFLVKMAAPLTLLLIVAVTIRAVLFRSSLADLIAERVEVVSPITAWKRGKPGGGAAVLGAAEKAGSSPASCCGAVKSNRFKYKINEQTALKGVENNPAA